MILASSSAPTTVVLGALIGATGVLVIGLLTLYFQQRNRGQDRNDAAAIARVSAQTSEISTAFQAWQQVNAANTTQIATLNERVQRAEERAERCEGETVPKLRNEVDELRGQLRQAVDEVAELRRRVDGAEEAHP